MNNMLFSLYDQLHFNDLEIADRLKLLDFSRDEASILREQRDLVLRHINAIITSFYERQLAIDDVALIIGDADTLARLKSVQRDYILSLFGGDYGHEYVNHRLRVGLVHKRIGVKPKLYLGGINCLKDILLELSLEKAEPATHRRLFIALDKLLYFDMTLVFDAYIHSIVDELEIEKARVEEYARELETTSKVDPLTKLLNRRALEQQMTRCMAYAKRSRQPVTAVVLDMDGFKGINDDCGHAKGDEVLSAVGRLILEGTREHVDIPCRYGGDEFVVVLPNCTEANAMEFVSRIGAGFKAKFPTYSFSVGIAQTGPDEFIESELLIDQADNKMYQAKRS